MTIIIEHLTFESIIGILEAERIIPQRIIIDCIIDYSYIENNFINYALVTQLIEETMVSKKFLLIEEALESLSQILKETFPLIGSLTLTLRKPDILHNCTVGVQHKSQF